MAEYKYSCTHLVVGCENSGKTTYIKENVLLKGKRKHLVYDPTQSYEGYNRVGGKGWSMEKFVRLVIDSDSFNYHTIVFSDATSYFGHSSNVGLVNELLTTKGHRKQTFVFEMHYLGAILREIRYNAKFITLFPTFDTIYSVSGKYVGKTEIALMEFLNKVGFEIPYPDLHLGINSQYAKLFPHNGHFKEITQF